MSDQNQELLVGVLAVQLGLATPLEVLAAAETVAPSVDLAACLEQGGVLTAARRTMLEGMRSAAVEAHGGCPAEALESLGGAAAVAASFGGCLVLGPRPASGASPAAGEAGRPDLERVTPEAPGRYRPDASGELGRGGIGRVLLAEDAHLGRTVAVKELLRGDAGSTGSRSLSVRFLREARVTASLEHPHIVPIYELGRRPDGTLYYTMKVVRGRSLAQALAGCKGLPDRLALLDPFRDLCQAIAYAHSRGVIHRDIKPANVMLGEFGETVVLDWGLAKQRGSRDLREAELRQEAAALQAGADGQTIEGEALGTPAYMSPEQAAGEIAAVDERSDVWGLGAVLFELLTGRPPFTGHSAFEVMGKVMREDVPSVRGFEPAAPPDLTSVAEKALCRDPAGRYPQAGDLLAEVNAFLQGARVGAYQYGAWELLARFARRYRAVLSVAAVALLTVLGLGVWSYGSVREERDRAQAAEGAQADSAAEAVRERDRAREALSEALVEKARATESSLTAMLYAASSLEARENPEARGLLARHALAPWLRLGWRSPPGMLCPRLAASADGTRLACLGMTSGLLVWDPGRGEEIWADREPGVFSSDVSLSADGRVLAIGQVDGQVRIVDLTSSAREERTWPVGRLPILVRLDPDGSRLAAGEKGTDAFRILERASGRLLSSASLAGCQLEILAAGGTAERWRLAAACEDGVLWVWEAGGPRRLPGTVPGLVALAVSRDGRRLAAGTRAGVRLVDLEAEAPPAVALGPPEPVTCLAFDPAGQAVLAGGAEGGLVRLPLDGGSPVELGRHTGRVLSLEPLGGDRLASSGHDAGLRLWDAAGGGQRGLLEGQAAWAYGLAFSPDGQRLWVASVDGSVRPWEVASGRPQPAIVHRPGHAEGQTEVLAVAVSPDGGLVATSGIDRAVRLWDARDGRLRHAWADLPQFVMSLDFSPAGDALAGLGFDGLVRRWEPDSGRSLAPWPVGSGGMSLRYSPDGRWLAAGLRTQEVILLDAAHGRVHARHAGYVGMAGRLAFSSDGRRLAFPRGNKTVAILDPRTGREVLGLSAHTGAAHAVAWAPGDALLATGSADGSVRLWDPSDGRALDEIPLGAAVHALAFSPAGDALAAVTSDRLVRLWSVGQGEPPGSLPSLPGTRELAFDGQRLIALEGEALIRGWDVRTGRAAPIAFGTDRPGRVLMLAPDGSAALLEGDGGRHEVWSLAEGRRQGRLALPREGVRKVLLSPLGEWIGLVYQAGAPKLFHAPRAEAVPLEALPEGQLLAGAAFSPDGRWLAAAGNGVPLLHLWSLPEGRLVRSMSTPSPINWAVAWSPDARFVALGGTRQVGILELERAETRAVLRSSCEQPSGLAFGPGGRLLVLACLDGSQQVWDWRAGRELLHLDGCAPTAASAACSPDGQVLASLQADGSIRLLDLGALERSPADWSRALGAESGLRVEGVRLAPDPAAHTTRLVLIP